MAWCPLAEPVAAPLGKCVRVSAVLLRINRTVAFICQNYGLRPPTIKFSRPGAPEVLEFIETHVPTPAPTEVRIKVKAIGLNRAESV